jgi:hypothetical protein
LTSRPGCLTPRERTPVHIEWETGWVSEPFWTFLRSEKSLARTEIRTTERPACTLDATREYGESGGIAPRIYNFSVRLGERSGFRP